MKYIYLDIHFQKVSVIKMPSAFSICDLINVLIDAKKSVEKKPKYPRFKYSRKNFKNQRVISDNFSEELLFYGKNPQQAKYSVPLISYLLSIRHF